MTQTCYQCGAILPEGARVCDFCDSSFADDFVNPRPLSRGEARESRATPRSALPANTGPEASWQGEVSERVAAFRTRRRKSALHAELPQLPFDEGHAGEKAVGIEAADECSSASGDSFSFTIAIGRPAQRQIEEQKCIEIDVSAPAGGADRSAASEPLAEPTGTNRQTFEALHPLADWFDRKAAAVIDAMCLLFAYGGFLTLFGSLGGQFTLSKLSAAVYLATFAIVYVQYFALFTVFGGTTPGMMMRGLQVVSFSGDTPSPRQMLWRAAGYLLSAGTFLLGFVWAFWDEDSLTWHDRISHTYLSYADPQTHQESPGMAHGR